MSHGVDRAVRWGTAELTRAGVQSPAVDAEQLLAHAAGRVVGELRRDRVLGRDLDETTLTAYRALVERRATRVPLQHLTGTAHFAGLDLTVGPGVFVPRPETEMLRTLALAELERTAEPVVLDLCTGSGALALALAAALPTAWVGAVELSPEAHRYAATNLAAHPAGARVDLRLGPAQEAFPELLGRVDVITCNPPYIPSDAEPVDPEVREHDPELALYGGGEDGLEVPRQIAGWALRLLRPGGVLLMEHADAQGESLPGELRQLGFVDVSDHPDLGGRPRVARGARAQLEVRT